VNDLNRLRRTVVPFILLWRRRFDVRLIVSDSCESAAFFVNPQTREVASARLRPSLLRRFAQYFFCLTGRGGGGRGSIVYPAHFLGAADCYSLARPERPCRLCAPPSCLHYSKTYRSSRFSVRHPSATRTSTFAAPAGDQPVAYLNSGSILSPSLMPPGSITLLSVNFSVS